MKARLMMRFSLCTLIFFTTVLMSPPSGAQLSINKEQSEQQVARIIEPALETVIRLYAKEHSAQDKRLGDLGVFTRYDGGNFAINIDEDKYFSNIGSLVIDASPTTECIAVLSLIGNDCDWMRMRHLTCHFFLIDKNLQLAAVTALQIPRDEKFMRGFPMCLSVEAVGTTLEPNKSMLITLGYIDSAEPAASDSAPTKFYKTILLRFRKSKDMIVVEQDDSCLGRANKIRSIKEARKKLGACRKK